MKKTCIVLTVLLLLLLALGMQAAAAQEQASETAASAAGDWWNILLLGSDSRDGTYGRTDSMIILSISKAAGKARMTTVMPGTWVEFDGKQDQGAIGTANALGGPAMAVETVNACFGTDIKDYALINMAGMIDVIDQIGGIDIQVAADEWEWLNEAVQDYLGILGGYEGETSLDRSGDSVHLNGLLAMTFCRSSTTGPDDAVTLRQRRVLLAVLQKLKAADPAQLMSVVMSAFEDVETSLSLADVLSLASVGLSFGVDSIEQCRIPADGTFELDSTDGSIRADFDANRKLLSGFIYGKGQ
jgi:LCP family protein required for cell wall assembly